MSGTVFGDVVILIVSRQPLSLVDPFFLGNPLLPLPGTLTAMARKLVHASSRLPLHLLKEVMKGTVDVGIRQILWQVTVEGTTYIMPGVCGRDRAARTRTWRK